MATYKYKCEKCNEEIEITKPMADSSKEEFCEECKHPLKRIYSLMGCQTFGDGYRS